MQYYIVRYCLACLLVICFSGTGFAHRVNIFAYVDGDAIQVECYFSKSQKVTHGKLTFSDLKTGVILHEGTTDTQGMFRFHPDMNFLESGHGLNIQLYAGEGHQNHWQIEAEELEALLPVQPARQETESAPQPPVTKTLHGIDCNELEELIGKIMDSRLTPIRQAIAAQQDSTPTLQDIIGGIGWILGLLGLATYIRYRPRQQ